MSVGVSALADGTMPLIAKVAVVSAAIVPPIRRRPETRMNLLLISWATEGIWGAPIVLGNQVNRILGTMVKVVKYQPDKIPPKLPMFIDLL